MMQINKKNKKQLVLVKKDYQQKQLTIDKKECWVYYLHKNQDSIKDIKRKILIYKILMINSKNL